MSGDLDTFFCGQMRWGGKHRHLGAYGRQIVVVDLFFSLSQTYNVNVNVKHFFFVCFFFLYLWPTVPLEHLMPPQLLLYTGFTRWWQEARSQAASLKNTTKNLGIGKKVNTAFLETEAFVTYSMTIGLLASLWVFHCLQSALCCLTWLLRKKYENMTNGAFLAGNERASNLMVAVVLTQF